MSEKTYTVKEITVETLNEILLKEGLIEQRLTTADCGLPVHSEKNTLGAVIERKFNDMAPNIITILTISIIMALVPMVMMLL